MDFICSITSLIAPGGGQAHRAVSAHGDGPRERAADTIKGPAAAPTILELFVGTAPPTA